MGLKLVLKSETHTRSSPHSSGAGSVADGRAGDYRGPLYTRAGRHKWPLEGITLQLFIALQHVHSRGVMHQDVKPTNIMVCEPDPRDSSGYGCIKLTDFGLSTMKEGRLTTRCGTPGYVAPEVLSWYGDSHPQQIFNSMATIRDDTASRPGLQPVPTITEKEFGKLCKQLGHAQDRKGLKNAMQDMQRRMRTELDPEIEAQGFDKMRSRITIRLKDGREISGWADVIITSGGVSAGAFEVVKDALTDSDDIEFVKVAMQPGMPQGAGRLDGVPVVTLPGNPVSALVSFEVFVRPALRVAMGRPDAERPRRVFEVLCGNQISGAPGG